MGIALKILLIVLVSAAVLFGKPILRAIQKERRERKRLADEGAVRPREGGGPPTAELELCSVCGAYVEPSAPACTRAECPYTR